MHSLPRSVQAYVNGMMEYTLTNAGECVQVAAVWQTADPAASLGTSGSLRMASGTNKALADAQKQLRISQQQASTLLHMGAISKTLVVNGGSSMISCFAACVWQPVYAREKHA